MLQKASKKLMARAVTAAPGVGAVLASAARKARRATLAVGGFAAIDYGVFQLAGWGWSAVATGLSLLLLEGLSESDEKDGEA